MEIGICYSNQTDNTQTRIKQISLALCTHHAVTPASGVERLTHPCEESFFPGEAAASYKAGF